MRREKLVPYFACNRLGFAVPYPEGSDWWANLPVKMRVR